MLAVSRVSEVMLFSLFCNSLFSLCQTF